jgi:hypothetical protein
MLPNLDELNIAFVDPSLRSSGVFIIRHGKIESYALQWSLKEYPDRLRVLAKYAIHFTKLCKGTAFDLLVIEDYQPGSKGTQARVAGEVGGVIRAIFAAHQVPVIEIPIMTWKGLLKFNLPKTSVSDKSEYINECLKRYGVRFQTVDEVDAFLFFQALKKCSRGDFVKGMGSKIRDQLEKLYIDL